MGATHLEPVFLTVPQLPQLKQWYTSCVSPANAIVIVVTLNSKCHVALLASPKVMTQNVGVQYLFGLLLKTLAVIRVTQMTQDNA